MSGLVLNAAACVLPLAGFLAGACAPRLPLVFAWAGCAAGIAIHVELVAPALIG